MQLFFSTDFVRGLTKTIIIWCWNKMKCYTWKCPCLPGIILFCSQHGNLHCRSKTWDQLDIFIHFKNIKLFR